MKAKMTKLCLLFILLCSLPVFYSCSDEADAFYFFFNGAAMSEIYTLTREAALPEVQSWELRVA